MLTEEVGDIGFMTDVGVPNENGCGLADVQDQHGNNYIAGEVSNGSPLTDAEWESGILLVFRQKFHIPYEALLFISSAIHDYYHKQAEVIQVNNYLNC